MDELPSVKPEAESKAIENLLRLNIVNLARKLKDGKTLSPTEVELLESRVAKGKWSEGFAANQVQLAEALGVTRKSIQRWMKIPGNPGAKPDGRMDVAEWRKWASDNGHKLGDDELDPGRLRAKNLLLQNQHLEFKIGILRRNYVPIGDVERVGGELAGAIRKVVTTLHLSAPSLAGLNVQEIETFLKEREDEIIDQLHTLHSGMDDLKREKPEDALEDTSAD